MRLFKFLGISILLIFLIGVGIATFFENTIERVFVKQINEYISTELKVEGGISLSLFKDFPNASLTFYDVKITESIPGSRKNMLEVAEIGFLFGLFEVFSDSYTVKSIVIRDGLLHLKTSHKGKNNYHIFVESDTADESANNANFNLNLEGVYFENVQINYLDEAYEQSIKQTIENGVFSGNFGASQYTLDFEGYLLSQQIKLGDTDYLSDKKMYFDLAVGIDFDKNRYTFDNNTIEIAGNRFALSGYLDLLKSHNNYDLTFEGQKLQLAKLLALLPGNYSSYTEAFSSRGNLAFEAVVKGKQTETEHPNVALQFNLEKGTLDHDDLDYPLKNINLKGNFSNGFKKTLVSSTLNIEQFDFSLINRKSSINGSIQNFDAPFLDLLINSDLPLTAFRTIAAQYGVQRLGGAIALEKLVLRGKFKEFTDPAIQYYPNLSGTLLLKTLSGRYNRQNFDAVSGKVRFDNKDLEISQLKSKLGNSDLSMHGTLKRAIPFLFQTALGDSTSRQMPIEIDLEAQSTQLNLDELLLFMPETSDSTNTSSSGETISDTKQNYAVGDFKFALEKVKKDQVIVEKVRGDLRLNNRQLFIQQLVMDLLGGKVDIRGDFKVNTKKELICKNFLTFSNIDMRQFMTDFDNFGQDYFTHKNIKGTFSAKMYLTAYFDKALNFDGTKLKMVADLLVKDGELLNFEPMLALSSFAKLSDLKRVQFARLENQIKIEYQKLKIPVMYINSNVFKMAFSGIHHFSNRVDYYCRLNLLNLLMGKFKKNNKNVKASSNKKGGLNLYLTMRADAYDPQIKYGQKKAVERRFRNDAAKEWVNLDYIMTKEFGIERGSIPSFEQEIKNFDKNYMDWIE